MQRIPALEADGEAKAGQAEEGDEVERRGDAVEGREALVELHHGFGWLRGGVSSYDTRRHDGAHVGGIVGLAVSLLEAVALEGDLDGLGADNEQVGELGDKACDNEEALDALLNLPPVRGLENGPNEVGVEVEVRGEERAGQGRRSSKVQGLELGLELAKRLALKRAKGLEGRLGRVSAWHLVSLISMCSVRVAPRAAHVQPLAAMASASLTIVCHTFVPRAVPQVRR